MLAFYPDWPKSFWITTLSAAVYWAATVRHALPQGIAKHEPTARSAA